MKHPVLDLEINPVIEAYKQNYDRTLIREHLKLTVEQRCERLLRLQATAEELRRAGLEAKSKK